MDIREKQHSGLLYLPGDDSLQREQLQCLDRLFEYNQVKPSDLTRKTALLKEMFAEIGADCYIETPFHANWGGHHVHFGKNIYANFNLTLVDDTHIYVGDYTQFGPNCVLATAGHPIDPELREQLYQYNAPIRIGRNCWLGANVVVVPGVTIGDNVVIGAGSVVTRDLPENVIAVGNPCKILRKVSNRDREYYFKDRKIDWSQHLSQEKDWQTINNRFDEKKAFEELEKGYNKAKEVLNDSDKMERFLQRLEKKLKTIPLAGDKLAVVPVMASLIKYYVKKEYEDVPIGTIIAIISALTYVISPIDLVPDSIPVLGYFDDAAVVAACWKLVESDVEEFIQWREKNNKVIDIDI